jgi:hypothetical protein
MNTLAKRPTESLTGPALGLAVYGFTTQVGLPTLVAAILAVIVAFGPLLVSNVVDALHGSR